MYRRDLALECACCYVILRFSVYAFIPLNQPNFDRIFFVCLIRNFFTFVCLIRNFFRLFNAFSYFFHPIFS